MISISWVPRLEDQLRSRRKTGRGKERANEGSSSERKSSLLPRAFGLTTRLRLQRRQHISQIKRLKAFGLFFNIATWRLVLLENLQRRYCACVLYHGLFLGYTSHSTLTVFGKYAKLMQIFTLRRVREPLPIDKTVSKVVCTVPCFSINKRGYNLVPRLFLLDLHLYDKGRQWKESLETRLTTQLIIGLNKDTLTIPLKNTLGSRAQFHFVYFRRRAAFSLHGEENTNFKQGL